MQNERQKRKQKELIEKFTKVHGDKYGYDRMLYLGSKVKIEVWCKVHQKYFKIRAANHALGRGCPDCRLETIGNKLRKTKEEFVKQARAAHGDRYDYSNFEYINAYTKSKVWCKNHQEYFEAMPGNHIKGVGCPKCAAERRGQQTRLGFDQFIKRAKEVHGERYIYPETKENYSYKDKVPIICRQHGLFYQSVAEHLRGSNCIECATIGRVRKRTMGWKKFVEKAKEVHGDVYTYPLQKYTNNREKLRIICDQHGQFWQTADNHLAGKGCPSCTLEGHGWRRGSYYRTTLPAYFYLLKAKKGEEEWIKVGITKKLKSRLKYIQKETIGTTWEVVHTWEGPAWECYNLEWFALYGSGIERYKNPEWSWGGHGECFLVDKYEPLVQHINSVADTLIGVCQTK